ncbi:uncharacterized protein TRAVEDRAFT_43380 [Trametes versicolor FP-101664 SS1]|uniref:uncharacterized protein n=1 Tax=Trametes versicolor (strain FP-101664) TaxID=717944 RepID=UPI00046227C4|nr:uncharacterized protein TRAVEDRAFT_43380 [Trametes versicolor FP-101664 SS1]EIW63070.1 hypothetical protein TRAVEDRAFT_43380 [Trametes versicolor FP-101664 SS1]
MQLRLPLWYIFVLLWAFALRGRAAPACRTSKQARDDGDDDDSDDDDDDDNNSSSSSNQHNACGQHNGVSGGAVAGIVIGCLIFLLLLCILLACWYRRRTRSQKQVILAAAAVAPTPPMKELSPSFRSNGGHPPSIQPSSLVTHSSAYTVPGPVIYSDTMGRGQTRELRNLPPPIAGSVDSIALPNPYEQGTPPLLPPRDDDATSPTSPVSRYASVYSTSSPTEASGSHSHARSYSYSVAPSAWTSDDSGAPLLSRGTTQASRLTATSSLHEEMAGYQKALEAHHQKEQDDAQHRENRIGEGSAVPEDPPPVYRDREEGES